MIDDITYKKILLEELNSIVTEIILYGNIRSDKDDEKVEKLLDENGLDSNKKEKNLFEELKIYLRDLRDKLYIHRNEQPNIIYDMIIDDYLKTVKGIASIVPGLATSIYDDKTGFSLETYSGVTSDDGEEIDENTRFDFASLTKLFTAVLVLKLKDNGLFDDSKSIKELSNGLFKNLDIPASQLEKFCACIRTEERIDGNISEDMFKKLLFNARKVDGIEYEYNDILYIILKMLLPTNEDYFEKYFHDEMRLMDISYRKFGKMTGGGTSAIDLPYDPKAKNMIKFGFSEPGHAGLFGTSRDLVKFHKQLRSVLKYPAELGKKSLLEELVTKGINKDIVYNDKGKAIPVNKGMGVYLNIPGGLKKSEVVPYLSKNAFSAVGSSGTYSTHDLSNGLTANFLSNPYSGDKPIMVDTSDPKYNFGDVLDDYDDAKQLRVMKKKIELYDKNGDPIRKIENDKIVLDKDGNEVIETIPFVRITNELKIEQIKTLIGLRLANKVLYRVANELAKEESEIAIRKLDDSNLGNNTSVVKRL